VANRAMLLALDSADPPAGHDGMYPAVRCSQRTIRCRSYEAYAKVSLKKYKPMAARNEDRNVSSGLL
jgi:hypothetical protein